MSLFGSSKTPLSDLFKGIEDCHSHILPGVDDGVQTMEDSLSILAMYEELGVRKLWLTPHIMEDVPNETEELKSRFLELKEEYEKDRKNRESSFAPIELSLAAEYMIDGLFSERLAKKDILPHYLGSHLLVETSYYNPPYNLKETLSAVLSAGYYPILAHPERYVYMDKEDYKDLKRMNVRFQMNLSSLAGMYGKDPVKKARNFLKETSYNFIGSDLHRKTQLEALINIRIDKLKYPLP